MSDWTENYLADIEYNFGYCSELNPLRLALLFLNAGLAPPAVATACELGYGQGVSVNIHAAASDVRWFGTDPRSGSAAFARSLSYAARSDAQLFDQSFAEFCARTDLPDFDFIALNGVYNRISDGNRQAIVDFVRRKLKVGGVLYLGYNTIPGVTAAAPLQHLIQKYCEIMTAPGNGPRRVDAALDFIDQLFNLNPAFVAANPGIAEHFGSIKSQNRHFTAHEYLNEHWRPVGVADMAKQLAPAKLSFACSASFIEHLDVLNLTPEQRRLLAAIANPVFRQTVRDFIVNQQFRRDLWVRGARRLSPLEQADAIRQQKIMLAANREDIVFSVVGVLGKREMAANVYGPVLDALGDGEARTIGEIEEAASGNLRLGTIVEAITVLAAKGDVIPVQDEDAQAHAKPQVDRLNLSFLERARSSGELGVLASPVAAGGVNAGRFDQIFLLALRQGPKSEDELARFAWDVLDAQGQRLARDNKALETPEENLAELASHATDFIGKRLPLLRRLQIA